MYRYIIKHSLKNTITLISSYKYGDVKNIEFILLVLFVNKMILHINCFFLTLL